MLPREIKASSRVDWDGEDGEDGEEGDESD